VRLPRPPHRVCALSHTLKPKLPKRGCLRLPHALCVSGLCFAP
jgi:hypothetical protein